MVNTSDNNGWTHFHNNTKNEEVGTKSNSNNHNHNYINSYGTCAASANDSEYYVKNNYHTTNESSKDSNSHLLPISNNDEEIVADNIITALVQPCTNEEGNITMNVNDNFNHPCTSVARNTSFAGKSGSSKSTLSTPASMSTYRIMLRVLFVGIVFCIYFFYFDVFGVVEFGFGTLGKQRSSSSSSTSVIKNMVGYHKSLNNNINNNNNIIKESTIDYDHRDRSNNNDPTTPIAAMFNFEELFVGVKKRTPDSTLQSPPPTARSILLVLHAEAIPENPTVIADIDRQLTPKGQVDAEGLGVYLKEHMIPEPDWIFSSPSERTAYTTELIRRNWASKAPIAFEEILYTLAFNDYFAFVAGLNFNFRRIMIVGHNPAILNTAKKLMKTHGIEDFPDCGFMEIRWDDLYEWMTVAPFTGTAKMAVDPNNNFFYTSK